MLRLSLAYGLVLFQSRLARVEQRELWEMCRALADGPVPMYTPTAPRDRARQLEEAPILRRDGCARHPCGKHRHTARTLGLSRDGADARGGLSAREILEDATINGARLLGRKKELGTVEAGKLADFVLLDADLLADITNTASVHLVGKNGAVFEPAALVPATPEEVVQRQLNAYNARDLEAFLATYGPDVEGFMHPSTPIFSGLDAIRKSYSELFEKAPALHCHVTKRIVIGERVIDHERVTGMGDGVVEAVAIYEVRDGLIRKVWFIPGSRDQR